MILLVKKEIYKFYMYFFLNIIMICPKKIVKKNLVQLYFTFEVLWFYPLQQNPFLLQWKYVKQKW
jgi:hypothetical protein